MNKQFLKVLLVAFLIAGGATLLFYRMIAGKLNTPTKPVTADVFVAARDLPVGTLVRDVDVSTASWSGTVPPSAVLKKEDLVGRGVVSDVFKGELMLETRLAAKGAGGGLAATIPPGMRAVAVRVNEIAGVAGFVTPGMRVDVLISGTAPGANTNAGTLSKTLLQNIQVLSAGQNIQKDSEGKPVVVPVVNLLVTPEQAESLSLAGTETKVQLVLRNPLDMTIVKTNGTAVSSLFSGQKYGAPAPAAAPRPRARTAAIKPAVLTQAPKAPPLVVEVIQGSTRSSFKFEGESR